MIVSESLVIVGESSVIAVRLRVPHPAFMLIRPR